MQMSGQKNIQDGENSKTLRQKFKKKKIVKKKTDTPTCTMQITGGVVFREDDMAGAKSLEQKCSYYVKDQQGSSYTWSPGEQSWGRHKMRSELLLEGRPLGPL